MIGCKHWVQKLLDNQKEKLLDVQEVPNQANLIQTQIMIERGNPLLEPIERGNPQEIETRSFREEAVKHDRTREPVVCRDANHERSMLNEVDIDFRIPGLPLSVVKQADNYRVRELVKKIENHPHRQSLQRGLQQNNVATLSPPETDPQILERWGCADEVHLGKYIRAKDFGLEF